MGQSAGGSVATRMARVVAFLLFSLAAADNFMSELEKLKGEAGFDNFDSQKEDIEQDLEEKRVKRFPQFTHFGAVASPYAPAPAPYTPAVVHAPEPYVAPAPAPYAPPPPPPAPYAPPAPAPAPYAPAPACHEPAPYAPPPPV